MNTKDNQRVRLTKKMLKDAYISLMHKKSTDKITVKELCAAAELNRSTFYLHYNEPNDVLTGIEDELIGKTIDYISDISINLLHTPLALIEAFLDFLQENDEIFRLLLIENTTPHFKDKFLRFCLKELITSIDYTAEPKYKDYVFSFVVNGSLNILTRWIAHDYDMEKKELAELLFHISEGALASVL
ncbi:MAG: TetR family transcriptional regulator C-terminal domain-containing protein [Lachnospiraceae bacterium]|nr:TetR family transcriptional regulator C-terminal domain-containing protein [Lachnospiraceae bacterium]